MYNVVVNGDVIARAENVEQETIYILNYNGMNDRDISYLLSIPIESVSKYTDSGKYR